MQQKTEIFATLFRSLTMLLIGVIGWISVTYLQSIDSRFQRMDDKFNIFMENQHLIDKRMVRVEDRVFDGNKGYVGALHND